MLSIYVSASEVNVDFIKNGLDAAAALNSELEILEYTYVFVSVGDQGHTWKE